MLQAVHPDDSKVNPRVHPKYKPRYSVTNWAEYDLALVHRRASSYHGLMEIEACAA
jgi:hypothetical protein